MKTYLIFALFVITTSGSLVACGEGPIEEPVDLSGRPVKIIDVVAAGDVESARYPAVIGAGDESGLSFDVGGVIRSLSVSNSDPVNAGDLIARLDQRDFQSSVASARATLANAEDEYQRAVRLADQDAIAKNVLEQRKTQRDVAKTQLDSAEKALADTVLRAPFSGVVANVPGEEGDTVSPGTVVANIINVESLEATINLPASVVAQVPTRAERGAVVLLEAAPGREIAAKFSEADLVADATSQTYAVTFEFAAPENLLVLPGMNATVVLTTSGGGSGPGSVSVPLSAVQSDGNGQYVWLVDEESMTVSRKNVAVAPGIGDRLVVSEGLATGDQIIGAGGAYLAEGMKVTAWTQ